MRSCLRTALASLLLLVASRATGQEVIVDGMTWMTGWPSTWNSGAPKIVSDGLFYYAVICGRTSTQTCSVARKRGDGADAWMVSTRTFWSSQPATIVIDRKGRLNLFYNDYQLRHIRLDLPQIQLDNWTPLDTGFAPAVGYLHASYSAGSDEIVVTFNETSSWRLYVGRKAGDGAWTYAALPTAPPSGMYLYARTVSTPGKYAVLAGEHFLTDANFAYTGAMLFEASSASGPWTARRLYGVTGNNVGVPYQNWVLANDLQIDAAGRLRALLHITELGSGHANSLDGLFLLREEDGYAPRFIAAGIEDGFTLYVDPNGTHLAFSRDVVRTSPVESGLAWFRSTDGGVTWAKRPNGWVEKINPSLVDSRSGSMLGPSVHLMVTNWNRASGAFDSAMFGGIALSPPNTADRYDEDVADDDGTVDHRRGFNDAASGRAYSYVMDRAPDGSVAWTYNYSAGSYWQAYTADSDGSYRYWNSDGIDVGDGPLTIASLTPSSVPLGKIVTLSVHGANFKPGAIVRVNGVARTTVFVGSTQLTAQLLSSDAAVAGDTKAITVINLDGAISSASSVTITASPATLVAASTSVSPGGTATFTVANGTGNLFDWVGWFCPATGADTAYADWKYLTNSRTAPAASAAATPVTFVVPNAAGAACAARLFSDNGYIRLAASATVTAIHPVPTVSGLSPAGVSAGNPASIAVNGTGFTSASIARLNGSARTTTFVSSSQLIVAAMASDLPAPGATVPITVVNPAPGGGTSNAVALAVVAGPSITRLAGSSSIATYSISNTPGSGTDWVGWFCPRTAGDTAYVDWKYLTDTRTAAAAGVTSGTVNFPVFASGGTECEARLFARNGFVRLATSATYLVANPSPVVMSLSPAAVQAANATSISVIGGDFVRTSVVSVNGSARPTTFVSASQLTVSLLASDVASAGSNPVISVTTPAPGGGQSSLTLIVASGPILSAPNTAGPRSTVGIIVGNAPGNATDWVGWYCPSGDLDIDYIDWKYLNDSKTPPTTPTTSGTVSFVVPDGGGSGACQARLFANNSFTRLAESGQVSVFGTWDWFMLDMGPSPVAPGGLITVHAVNGGGQPTSGTDRVSLYCPAANPTPVDWKYVNNTKTPGAAGWSSATVTFTAPAQIGMKCEARLSGTWSMSSWRVTVRQLPPALSVPAATVNRGAPITVTASNGPANARDWVGLFCPADAADMGYVEWKYLSNSKVPPASGMSAAMITFTAPAAATTCQLRFFADDGFTRLASSAVITAQ